MKQILLRCDSVREPPSKFREDLHNHCFQNLTLKDRRRRPEGGEWEPIKIPHRNLAYIPKPTRDPSLLTLPRLISYGQAISLWKRTRIFTRNTEWCWSDHGRDRRHKLDSTKIYLLSGISPNTW
jgi:hypothetical protein